MPRVRQPTGVSDRTLGRLLRWATLALAVSAAAFAAVYLTGQHVDAGPTLAERQVQAAEAKVRSSPQDIGARLALAQAYRLDGRWGEALTQYDEVLRVEPANRGALLGRGATLLSTGDRQGAAQAFQKITTDSQTGEFAGADPQLQEAHYYLGSLAIDQGDAARAVVELQKALAIEKTDADAWFLLGRAHQRQGQLATAVKDFRQALLFVPTGWAEPYRQLAASYTTLGQPALAEYAAAMVDFCEERPDQATQRLRALTAGPAGTEALLGLGMVAESSSQRAEAVRWYQQVLTVDAKNVTAMAALARLGVTPSSAPTPSAKSG